MPWVEKRIGFALAESQIAAIRLALMSKVLVMTGGPGVGKTTIVKAILRILAAKDTGLLLCGKLNDQPVTLVSGGWRVTNNSDRDVKITNVRLSKYPYHQSARLGMRNPEDERNILVYGNFQIAPHQTLEVEVVLTFFPSIGRAPEPIISDVIFTDNFENQHSVRAKFTYGSKSR